jgi:tRNA 2-thiouridine synthesizing protein A
MATLDARGLRCPIPLVKTKLRMEELDEGDELMVMATDPEAGIDLAAWAADEGHELREQAGASWTEFHLRKGSSQLRRR